MVNGECFNSDFENGWRIELSQPTDILTPATVFQYVIDREETIVDSKQLSNIRICFCEDLLDQLESCSYIVYFDDGTSIESTDCFIDPEFPNENENPAPCPGLKFDNIPSVEGKEQVGLVLNFTLLNPAPIGPVTIGFKAGQTGSGLWEGVCGPVCENGVTRGVIL